MTKTKDAEVEPQAAAVDSTPDELRSWGLSSRPLRMAPADWVPVVAALRDANTGKGPVTSVQTLLDSTFPGKGYQASALTVASVPKGTFTQSPPIGTPGTGTHTFTSSDLGLKLPQEHYQWDFGDGTRATGSKVVKPYAQRGDYAVTHTVNLAGQAWSSRQSVKPWGGPLPTVSRLSPQGAVIGDADVDVHVYGTGFGNGTTHVLFNEVEQAHTYYSDTEVTFTVKPSAATTIGTLPVAVTVDNLGRSNSVGFDVWPAGTTRPTATEFADPDEPKPPKDDDKIVVEGEVVGTREEPEPQVMQGGGDVLMPGAGLPESEPGKLFIAEQPGEASEETQKEPPKKEPAHKKAPDHKPRRRG